MLPAAHRLKRSDDFAMTVRSGRRVGRGSVVVHLKPASPEESDQVSDPVRAGFVVSKAVGNAVTRNKVKRRLRHLVAERLVQLPPGAMLVVRAQPGAGGIGYPEMGADLDAALAAVLEKVRRTS